MKVIYPNQQTVNKPKVKLNDIVKLMEISNLDGKIVL